MLYSARALSIVHVAAVPVAAVRASVSVIP
jgi:hypothetical protein